MKELNSCPMHMCIKMLLRVSIWAGTKNLPRLHCILILVLMTGGTMSYSPLTAYGHDEPVELLRAFFFRSVESEEAILDAERYLAELGDYSDPTVHAYAAMFSIMNAKHVFWPGKKMEYLKAGLPVLDSLIQKYPDHAEIRYLRLLGCYYLPRFLKRGWSVDEGF